MLAASGAGAGLVAGASPAADRTDRVRALRPFLIGGERIEADTELDVPWRLAIELRTANKVEILPPAEADAAAPEQPEEGSPE